MAMNVIIRRYAEGRPIQERLQMEKLWERLERRIGGKDPSLLPTFGRVAHAFIQEMAKRGHNSVPPFPIDPILPRSVR